MWFHLKNLCFLKLDVCFFPRLGKFSALYFFSNKLSASLSLSSCAVAAKSLQSCPTLCDPIDSSPSGSPVPGILQARTLEWVAISFANAWNWKVKVKSLSRVRLLATPWTAAYQAPLSMGFSRHEYWSGGPLLSLLPLWDPSNTNIQMLDIVQMSLNCPQF